MHNNLDILASHIGPKPENTPHRGSITLQLVSCFTSVIHFTHNLFSFLVKSILVKPETSHTVIIPPTVSVTCPNYVKNRAGALVYWLWEETHVPKVVGSNPGTVYWMDIFSQIFVVKIVMFV